MTNLGERVGCPTGAPPWNQPTSLQLEKSQHRRLIGSDLNTYTNHCHERNSLSMLISVHSDCVASYVPKHSLVMNPRIRHFPRENSDNPHTKHLRHHRLRFHQHTSASSGVSLSPRMALTVSHHGSFQEFSPCFRGVQDTPSTGRSTDTILHLQSITELEESSIWTRRRACTLPVSQRSDESRCDIVKMGKLPELECILEEVDGGKVVTE